MKQLLILLSFAALTLISCEGRQARTETTEDKKTLDSDLQTAGDFLKQLPENPDKEIYFYENNIDTIAGLAYSSDLFYAYPLKNGGYLTVLEHCDMIKDGYIPIVRRRTYIYKDRKLLSTANVLPVPDPVSFTNAEKRAEHKADFEALSALYKRRAHDFINYVFIKDKPEIRAFLRFINYDDHEWKQEYSALLDGNDKPSYKWDGEQFVLYDPMEDFLTSLPKSPDKDVYHKRTNYVDLWDLDFWNVQENCYALPMNDGGYLGIFSFSRQCGDCYYSTYVYNDGKIKSVANVFPVPEISSLFDLEKCTGKDNLVNEIANQYNNNPKDYLLYYISDDGTLSVSAAGNRCEQWSQNQLDLLKNAVYKWDGKKFVK